MPFLACLIGLAVVSCGSDEKKETQETSGAPNKKEALPEVVETREPEKPQAPEEPAVPPLAGYALNAFGRSLALVRIPGQPDRQGVILKSSYSGSRLQGLMLCEVPEGVEEVAVAMPAPGRIETFFARRVSALPSGLSVYQFDTNQSFSGVSFDDPPEGATYHAVQLAEDDKPAAAGGNVPEAEDLETVREKMHQLREREMGLRAAFRQDMRSRPGGRPTGNPHANFGRDRAEISREMAELLQAEARLRAKSLFPEKGIKPSEVAAGKDADGMGDVPDGVLLVTSARSVVAIRSGGRWVSIKDTVEASGGKIVGVDLKLTGYNQSLTVSCQLRQLLPFGESGFSMVAASTFELEALGSGSAEDRLALVERVRFSGSANNPTVSRQIKWNGQPSKVWVRVYSDKDPDKPLLDEVIAVSYADRLVANWDKPPSSLIELPEPPPNQPEDLVSLAKTIAVQSDILDIVAAGDGSVVMVRTEGEPYWAPLDLKTGEWLPAEWNANANTLLAAQAGKVYLLDRTTRVMEIRDLATGNREGLQLLPFEGTAVAFGAPLVNPDKPVMVATEMGVHFFDPVRFEPVITGADFHRNFDKENGSNSGTLIDPATIGVRVSGDGVIYSLRGWNRSEGRSQRFVNAPVVLGSSSIAVASVSEQGWLASKGRTRSRNFPDHGGSGLELSPVHGQGTFPGPAGKIEFRTQGDNRSLASLEDLPVIPPTPGRSPQKLADDRGCYFDSGTGVLLVPGGKEIHFRKLDLPPVPASPSPFLLPGESLEIPLAPGSGHSISSPSGGTSVVEGGVIRWTAPASQQRGTHSLKLQWQGELGSRMEEGFRVDVMAGLGTAEAVSPDGAVRIPLKLRGILPSGESIAGIAGSGHVAFTKSFGKVAVQNLATCELLHQLETRADHVIGDADHLYLLENGRKMTALDIASGKMLAEKDFPAGLRSLATGCSSRLPLLAVEQDRGESTLLMVDRMTLDTRITELTDVLKQGLFAANLESNASGSAMWSRQVSIQRDGRAITVRTVPRGDSLPIMDGIPDATGRFVLDRNMVCDVSGELVKVVQIPGTESGGMAASMDASGRYLLVYPRSYSQQGGQVSVRTPADPGKEIFRVEMSSRLADIRPWLVSENRTFVCRLYTPLGERQLVYELDIPAILAELKR